MKKHFLFILLIAAFPFVHGIAQTNTFPSSGNVGIGTTSPAEKLELIGNLKMSSGNEIFFADNGQIRSFDNNHRILFRRPDNVLEFREYGDIIFSSGSLTGIETDRMFIAANGNVGIGTTTPQAKLAVSGDMYAKKVKVTQSGWPDYVFHTAYRLRPLSEVEQYIQLYHHLPEVPSAAEVEKEGVDLGDNQAALLKKIEELTLYIINLNKEVEILKKQIDRQKSAQN